MHEKYQNTVNSVHYVCCSACSAKGQHTQFDWSECNLLERARGLLREGREKWDRILLSRHMFRCVQVILGTWTQKMNMSSSLPDMSGYREDTVVDMWPQVSHRVHVLIGAFIVGSGQRGQIRSNQCRLSYHQIKHRHTLNFILVYLLYSGISGTVSNMSLLTIH